MPKRPKTMSRRDRPVKIERLAAAAAAFTDRTSVIENSFNAQEQVWRLGFDNGHTIFIWSDGTGKVVREHNFGKQKTRSHER